MCIGRLEEQDSNLMTSKLLLHWTKPYVIILQERVHNAECTSLYHAKVDMVGVVLWVSSSEVFIEIISLKRPDRWFQVKSSIPIGELDQE
jgi:hypothetical protein